MRAAWTFWSRAGAKDTAIASAVALPMPVNLFTLPNYVKGAEWSDGVSGIRRRLLMRKFAMVSVMVAVSAACSGNPASPEYVVPLTTSATTVKTSDPLSSTHLKGENEVPPRDTQAQGQAIMKVSADGLSVSYKLIASNIDNVIASHIHIGAVGTNGPIVQFLYGTVAAGGGRHDGVLAEGTFTAASFIGPLAGHPMSDLLAAMAAGNAYVNVHTNDGVGAQNTGPGDFPGGEIRGQVVKK